MGRTVRTATMLIDGESMRWGSYRSWLRKRDRNAFDNLVAYAKRHFSAIQNSNIPDPFEAVMLSIILEFEKRLERLEDEMLVTRCACRGRQDNTLVEREWKDSPEKGEIHNEDICESL